jgi:hypothetical protein
MSQANANKWIHLLHTVLNQTLTQQELLPARTAGEFATLHTSRQTKDGATSPPFWHDGTARPIHRPRDAEEQQESTVARRNATRSKTSS